MAAKAAAFLKDNVPEKAFPAFQTKDNKWHDRDLYVFVEESTGMMVSHGTNPGLIGKWRCSSKSLGHSGSISHMGKIIYPRLPRPLKLIPCILNFLREMDN
jgi:hypothetical protein